MFFLFGILGIAIRISDGRYKYSYEFNNKYSKFKQVLLDPIGHKNQNVFSIESEDTYNDIDWKFYQNGGVSSLTEISIKKETCAPQQQEKCEWMKERKDFHEFETEYKLHVCNGVVKEKVFCISAWCK